MSPSTRAAIGLGVVYAVAMLQGLTVVSFPASSATLKALHHFSDAEYGAVFLPQVVATIIGSLGGGALAGRIGLRGLLLLAALSSLLAEGCLMASLGLGSESAFPCVLVGSSLMGLGFGMSAAPLNSLPGLLVPHRPESALMGAHTAIGAGFCGGPLLAGALIERQMWWAFPSLLLGVALVCVLGIALSSLPQQSAAAPCEESLPEQPGARLWSSGTLWSFLAVAVLYAFAEGTLSNWVLIYLSEERGLATPQATLALAAFWAALVGGRLLSALLAQRVSAERQWLLLLCMLIVSFSIVVPQATTSIGAIASFAFAGLSCSAFFPLGVTLLGQRLPSHRVWTGPLMVAALMLGVGIASFAVGPLRGLLSLERIYVLSAAYPALALAVALAVLSPVRRRPALPMGRG